MINFKLSTILQNHKTVGEQLKLKRIEQNRTIKKISKKINIDSKYLNALENGDYHKLPNGLYGKKILKKYVEFLKLDAIEINNLFLQEKDTEARQKTQNTLKIKNNNIFSIQKTKWQNFIIFPKFGKGLIIGFAIIICFSYLWISLQNIFLPPKLAIFTPQQNNLIINQNNITIKGKTEPKTKIKINNKLVLNNNNGLFSETINLKNGINNITITASKKYGQENIIRKQILVKDVN